NSFKIGHINKIDHKHALVNDLQQVSQTVIHVTGRQYVTAGLKRLKDSSSGSVSRRKDTSVGTPLELGQYVFEGSTVGIGNAGVHIAAWVTAIFAPLESGRKCDGLNGC